MRIALTGASGNFGQEFLARAEHDVIAVNRGDWDGIDALLSRGVESRFATAFYGHLSPEGQLTYCNAGHNPPLLIRKDRVERLETGGLILGLFEHATFEEETVRVSPGDILVTFSDGVTEALSLLGEEYGEERLLECTTQFRDKSVPDLLEAILASVRQFTAGAVQSDDVTALVLRYVG